MAGTHIRFVNLHLDPRKGNEDKIELLRKVGKLSRPTAPFWHICSWRF